jgi:hypothetical protein
VSAPGWFAITGERPTSPPVYCPRCRCQARQMRGVAVRFGGHGFITNGVYCGVCALTVDHDELENANPNESIGWDFVVARDPLCLPCACGTRQGYCTFCETEQPIDPAAIAWANSPTTAAWSGESTDVDNDPRQQPLTFTTEVRS